MQILIQNLGFGLKICISDGGSQVSVLLIGGPGLYSKVPEHIKRALKLAGIYT